MERFHNIDNVSSALPKLLERTGTSHIAALLLLKLKRGATQIHGNYIRDTAIGRSSEVYQTTRALVNTGADRVIVSHGSKRSVG